MNEIVEIMDRLKESSENPPIVITSEDSDPEGGNQDSDLDLATRACDREEAETAYKEAIRHAEENLKAFRRQAKKEADLDRALKALKKRKKSVEKAGQAARKPIMAPGRADTVAGPPIVKGQKTETESAAVRDPDEVFTIYAKNVASFVMETMVADGVGDMPTVDELIAEVSPTCAVPLSKEEELEFLCGPEQLQIEGFSAPDLTFPDFEAGDPITMEELPQVLKCIFNGMASISKKLDHLVKNQKIHTLAHLANIKATALMRQLCVQDGAKKAAVYRKLQMAMKVVLLASDAELKELPFRKVAAIQSFFHGPGNINRVQKLAQFCLAYIEFGRGYATALIDTLIHVDLQIRVYWKSGTGNNG